MLNSVGDQCCTESATTIPYDEFARKSEGADFFRDTAFAPGAPTRLYSTLVALLAFSFAHLYS